MGYEPSAADWHDLLGVGPVIRDVFSGKATITSALNDLKAARERWPGTSEDWVAVVDATIAQVELLKQVSKTQADAMRELEDSLGVAAGPDASWQPPDLPHPVDRILTAEELAALENVDDWYGEIVAEHEEIAEAAEEELAEATSDYDDAYRDLSDALGYDPEYVEPADAEFGDPFEGTYEVEPGDQAWEPVGEGDDE